MRESLSDDIMKVRELISQNVIIDDARTVYIDKECIIGKGVRLEPNIILEGRVVIGDNSVIGANSTLRNCSIGENTIVRSSYIEDSKVGDRVTIGPFAYIRKDSVIADNCRIGDFVEIKKSVLHKGVKSAHLTYIGDAEVGECTNVGCGTVFANYNGIIKQRTVVGKRVFIGCNSNLVAPLSVGDNAYIAAGSTVTADVPNESLCIARQRQIIKPDWRK